MEKKHEHTHMHGTVEHTHDHDHDKEHGHDTHDHGHHHHEGCCGNHGHADHECCGHHHHDEDEEPITLDLILDDGQEVKCEVVGIFEVEGKEYIALLPFDDDRVLLYTYEEDGEELNLENIENDEEFKKVSETFWEIFGDEDFEKVDEE